LSVCVCRWTHKRQGQQRCSYHCSTFIKQGVPN
jgi:hypothetical protein